MKNIAAVISAGGIGTRLSKISRGTPKALVEINNVSILFRIAEEVKISGIDDLIILLGYKHYCFDDEINRIKKVLKLNVYINIEDNPSGECGAIWDFKKVFNYEYLLFINGDIVFNVDFKRLFSFTERLSSKFTLVTHTTTHPEDSDLVRAPNGSQITDFIFKDGVNNSQKIAFLGNTGISFFKTEILKKVKKNETNLKPNIFKHLAYEYFLSGGRVFSYNTSEYIKDMGTPERIIKVKKAILEKKIEKKCYRNKQKCLFLDRDNTLIECGESEYILSKDRVKIKDQNVKSILKVAKDFDLIIVVTNQPQISMGLISFDELYDINSLLINQLLDLGLLVDEVVFCPHHPHGGFSSEITFLKKDCFCRKPSPGLFLEQSISKNIDLQESLFIGDSKRDEDVKEYIDIKFLNVDNL